MRGIGYHTPRIAITSPIPQYVYAMTNNYVGPPVRQTRAVQCTRNDGTFKYTPCFIKKHPLSFFVISQPNVVQWQWKLDQIFVCWMALSPSGCYPWTCYIFFVNKKKTKDVGELRQWTVEEWEQRPAYDWQCDQTVAQETARLCRCRWWTVWTFSMTDILTTTMDVIVVS